MSESTQGITSASTGARTSWAGSRSVLPPTPCTASRCREFWKSRGRSQLEARSHQEEEINIPSVTDEPFDQAFPNPSVVCLLSGLTSPPRIPQYGEMMLGLPNPSA